MVKFFDLNTEEKREKLDEIVPDNLSPELYDYLMCHILMIVDIPTFELLYYDKGKLVSQHFSTQTFFGLEHLKNKKEYLIVYKLHNSTLRGVVFNQNDIGKYFPKCPYYLPNKREDTINNILNEK